MATKTLQSLEKNGHADTLILDFLPQNCEKILSFILSLWQFVPAVLGNNTGGFLISILSIEFSNILANIYMYLLEYS